MLESLDAGKLGEEARLGTTIARYTEGFDEIDYFVSKEYTDILCL